MATATASALSFAPEIEIDPMDDIQYLIDCDGLGDFPFNAEEAHEFQQDGIEISRKNVNDFLAKVCGMIDVDPAEAIAQNFPDYTTMCSWLVSKYNREVFAKFESQYRKIGTDLNRRVIDYWVREMPQYGREMRRMVPGHFKNFLYSLAMTSCWWNHDLATFLEADDAGDCSCTDQVTQIWFYDAYLQDEFDDKGVEDDADDAEWD